MIPFAAVLLAGGQSRRMGQDKALLTLPDGQKLWERQLDVLRQLQPTELYISGPARPGFPSDARQMNDSTPNSGPLGGIVTALQASHLPLLVVLAVDLPRMTSAFLRQLIPTTDHGIGTVPHHPPPTDLYEPLAAVYHADCLLLAEARLAAGQLSLQSIIRTAGPIFRPREITPAEVPLFANWNDDAGPSLI